MFTLKEAHHLNPRLGKGTAYCLQEGNMVQIPKLKFWLSYVGLNSLGCILGFFYTKKGK